MSALQVSYEPNPIPWIIHHDSHGKQTKPGSAHVTLTVYAVDADTGKPVVGVVNSSNSDPFIDDPNGLNFKTNTPQSITLYETTNRSESSDPDQPLHGRPEALVTAEGYEDASLQLL